MKMYNISEVNSLHIELTSKCNASCPACSRNFAGGAVVPGLKLEELTLPDIKQLIPIEILENLKNINVCGNLGDPGVATDLLGILQFFKDSSKQQLRMHVRTNGGMRSPEFWYKLGEFFKTMPPPNDNHIFSQSAVVFGVDGLEDTNHIYRRGVKWNKLLQNMKAYSDSGAVGIWEWLIFDHNKHQIKEAQEFAKELNLVLVIKNPLGFGESEGKNTGLQVFDKQGNYEYTIWPKDFLEADKTPPQWTKLDVSSSTSRPASIEPSAYNMHLAETAKISCKSIKDPYRKEIYITASGYLLPCCFLGGVFGNFTSSYSRYQFNEMINNVGLEHFDLRRKSLVKILSGDEFSKFFLEGWNKSNLNDGKILYCAETCGEDSAMDRLYISKLKKTIPILKI